MKNTALLILLTFPLLCAAPARAVTFDWATIGNIGHPSSFEGRHQLTKMLRETRNNVTLTEIKLIVQTLEEDK